MSESDDLETTKEHHESLIDSLSALKGIEGRHYVEARRGITGNTQVKLSLRVFDVPSWIQVLGLLFKEEIRVAERGGESWRLHVCRQYMYDEDSKKVKFTWIFSVTSNDLEAAIDDLRRLLDVIASTAAAPINRSSEPRGTNVSLSKEPRLFDTEGPEIVDGEVVAMPLLGKVGRNIPEGGLFEQGRGQKGAHQIKAGK
jgi:hypothetical protein